MDILERCRELDKRVEETKRVYQRSVSDEKRRVQEAIALEAKKDREANPPEVERSPIMEMSVTPDDSW